jgi:formylmethanofuran dehydrogenase subunit E
MLTIPKVRLYKYKDVKYTAPNKAMPAHFTTCQTCGRSWDDTKSTSMTPTPSGRCPFEYLKGHS